MLKEIGKAAEIDDHIVLLTLFVLTYVKQTYG